MQNKNSLLALLVLFIILIGAVFVFKYYKNDGRERVVYKNADINSEDPLKKVPTGLPRDVPLQLSEVTESQTQEYKKNNIVVSTITFKTFRNSAEVFSTYEGFMNNAGYEIIESGTNKELGVIYGAKEENTLGVIINKNTDADGKRSVQIVYTNYIK